VLRRQAQAVLTALIRRLPNRVRFAITYRLGEDFRKMWDTFRRETLATLFLRGEGIEVGALDHPLPVPDGVRVKYVDLMPLEKLKTTFPNLKIIKGPDIVDDGEKLTTIADASQDFVIANHFIEHSQDPIGTIKNFLRVLRPGGILYMALPDKRFTFDVDRPSTSFEHMLKDHMEGPDWSRLDHFREAIAAYSGATAPLDLERSLEFEMNKVGHTHFHVWSQEDMLTFVAGLRTLVGLDIEVEAYVSNHDQGEGILVLRKGDAGQDRRMADESLQHAREAFRARFNGNGN
jgi:SAM-dependent methyltransferase